MIIERPDFESMNQLADLAPGRYVIMESVYRLAGAVPCHAILSEIVPTHTGRSVGADLQVVLYNGTNLFRDFAIARDGGWRDSYGAKASTLAELLPPELGRFTLVDRKEILVVHDGKGQLSIASSPEHADGP